MRLAAVGDVHLGPGDEGSLRPRLREVDREAGALLLAGDLTDLGTSEEAGVVAREFADLPVPVVAVLGNHGHQGDRPGEVAEVLRGGGITILDGEGVVLRIGGVRLGIAGVKGFGGGFRDADGTAVGEREMKAFVNRSAEDAGALKHALHALDADLRVALTHYSPIPGTLQGEPREIYPFLGSRLLADAVDAGVPSMALHGHAHRGSANGTTPGGVPVHNVAQPVIGKPYAVFEVH